MKKAIVSKGQYLGALTLLGLGACADLPDNGVDSAELSVKRHDQEEDLGPSATASPGLMAGVTLWTVPATANGLNPDQSWFSVASAPDGKIYMGASDHLTNSALYRLNPADDVLRYLGDARASSEAASNWLPGETAQKFHVRPLWFRGRVYVATADYSNQDAFYVDHRGFHWYAYDAHDRDFLDLSASEPLGVAAEHISIFSTVLDESRGLIYGLGSPTAHLYQFNVATGVTTDLGRSPLLSRQFYNPGRFMWIDSGGRVYFTVATAGTLAPGEPATPLFPMYWDPSTGWGANTDWAIAEMLRTGQWSLDHKHLYILDYPLNLYRFDDGARTFTKLTQGILDADHISPRTHTVRVRSMNLSANEKKLYIINDTAVANSLFEWDFNTTSTPRELARTPALDDRMDVRYSAFTGHDSWDPQGRFYFTSFGGEGVPSTPNVYFGRVDPVRLKAGLGILPGVPMVTLHGEGRGMHLVRRGDLTSSIDVIVSRSGFRGPTTYQTVTMPAGAKVVRVPSSNDRSGHRGDDLDVSVIPDGDTYVLGHDQLGCRGEGRDD